MKNIHKNKLNESPKIPQIYFLIRNIVIIGPRVVQPKQNMTLFIFSSKKFVHTLNFTLIGKSDGNHEYLTNVMTRLNYNIKKVAFKVS